MLIDLVFVVFMVWAIIRGYSRGLIIAVFSLLALIAGVAAAMKFSAITAAWLKSTVHTEARWLPVLAYLLVFLLVALLVRMGAGALQKTVEMAQLGWANRLAGMLLYAMVYTVVLSVALFYGEKIHLIAGQTIAASITYPFIRPWGHWVIDGIGRVIPLFSNMFYELEAFFAHISGKIPPPADR